MDNRIFSSNISDSLFNTTLIVTTILVREGGTYTAPQASPALRGGVSWNFAPCSIPSALLCADLAKETRANLE